MIIEIDWTTFHMQYLNRSTVYVKEHDSSWDFYTSDEPFVIYCHVEKKENQEENFLFIERYLSGQAHIVKVMDIHGTYKKASQEASDVMLEPSEGEPEPEEDAEPQDEKIPEEWINRVIEENTIKEEI